MSNEKQLVEALNCAQSVISDRLKALGKVYKEGKWVSGYELIPYELKPRDIERRKTICEILFAKQQRKGFLHRIMTGDKKWIYIDNPKCRKIICDSGQPSTSTPKRNIHGEKAMLCIWWDQKGVLRAVEI